MTMKKEVFYMSKAPDYLPPTPEKENAGGRTTEGDGRVTVHSPDGITREAPELLRQLADDGERGG